MIARFVLLPRLLLPLLLWAAPAAAQGTSARVEEALLPETGTARRVELLDEIVRTDEGAAAIAARGLDPATDPAVVAAVVDALFRSDHAVAQLDRLCLLLVQGSPALRTKVERHFQIAGEHPGRAETLRQALAERARGVSAQASANGALRLGAVRALAQIPRRSAVETIVEVWREALQAQPVDTELVEACRLALRPVVPGETPDEVARYLERRPWFTYVDLVRAMVGTLLDKVDRLRHWEMEFLREAGANRVFQALAAMDEQGRETAARRIRELAVAGDPSDLEPKEFARLAHENFITEIARVNPNPEVVMRLGEALAALARDWEQSALAQVVEAPRLIAVLEPLSRTGAEMEPLGLSAVRILEEIGPAATESLLSFARAFASANVRIAAVRSLETLTRQGKESAAVIGAGLAGLLEAESDPKVRKQILFSLGQSPVPQALEPIRRLLLPGEDGGPELSTIELRDCIVILGRIGTQEALATLFEVSTGHPDPEVRRIGVADGLFERAQQGNGAETAVLEHLGRLVRDAGQPLDLRRQLIEEIGRKGSRRAHELLRGLARDETLDDALRSAAREAKRVLAERLVAPSNNGAVDAEDLATATAILGEELDRVDPVRGEKLARQIVKLAEERKVPSGNARALLALVVRRRGEVAPAELQQVFAQAAERAGPDGADTGVEKRLLTEYRELLVAGAPDAGRDRRAIEAGRRLAALAGEAAAEAAGHLLDAAEIAVERLSDRALAEELLAAAEAPGPLEGALATRLAELRAAARALPEKPS